MFFSINQTTLLNNHTLTSKTISIGFLSYIFVGHSVAAIVATFLPHGPATPTNPAWNQTAYRDVPWWFEDKNPDWNGQTPGAADAYDISPVWAARLNKNNSAGYEAAIINTPAFPHLGSPATNPYGVVGGAFGTSADSVTWGNDVKWNFTLSYSWNNGAPTASWRFQNGTTIHNASAALGSRIIDFVEGDITRPLTAGGQPNPYREPHAFNDMMMRFGTVGTTKPGTMNRVTVENMALAVDGAAAQAIEYYDLSGNLVKTLTTKWEFVSGGDTTSNPRQVQFLVMDNILPGHKSSLTLTGELTFAWSGSAADVSNSGLIFEAKLGDLDFFPSAKSSISVPEPSNMFLGSIGLLASLWRKRTSKKMI